MIEKRAKKEENVKWGCQTLTQKEKRESKDNSYYWVNARKTKQLEIWHMRHLSGQLSSDCDFRPAMFTKGVKFDREGCKNRESQRGNKEEGRKLGNFCWVSKRVKTWNEFTG